MTLGAALNEFYNQFGIKAYPNTNVPDDVVFPYITYDVMESSFGDSEASQTVQLWFKTDSEAVPNRKAEEIRQAIGIGGVILKLDNGCVWLKRGSPFCINSTAEKDNSIKLRQLNVSLEFFI